MNIHLWARISRSRVVYHVSVGVHSDSLTWKWTMASWKTTFLYKQWVLHFHVSESECSCSFGDQFWQFLSQSQGPLAHKTPWQAVVCVSAASHLCGAGFAFRWQLVDATPQFSIKTRKHNLGPWFTWRLNCRTVYTYLYSGEMTKNLWKFMRLSHEDMPCVQKVACHEANAWQEKKDSRGCHQRSSRQLILHWQASWPKTLVSEQWIDTGDMNLRAKTHRGKLHRGKHHSDVAMTCSLSLAPIFQDSRTRTPPKE